MSDHIPHAFDIRPRNLRLALQEIGGDGLNRFPDDEEVEQDGIEGNPRPFLITCSIALIEPCFSDSGGLDRIKSILEALSW